MLYRNNFSGKVVSAILLVATLFFGGAIIVAIANSLRRDNPLHFLLPPIFMFSWFIVLVIYLSRGKREEKQEDSNKTQLDKCEETSQDIFPKTSTQTVSMNHTIIESVETTQNNRSKDMLGKKNRRYLIICSIVCLLAFVILTLSIFIAGGTAFWGKIESGRFYLGGGGDYTEVSRLGYILSAVNSFILGILTPFAVYTMCLIYPIGGKTKRPDKKFDLFFIVFMSFIGGHLAIKSLVCCISAALTVN